MTDADLEARLRALFAVFPRGAGAGFLAGHFAVGREQLDRAALEVGAQRVEVVLRRPGAKGAVEEERGIEWRGPCR